MGCSPGLPRLPDWRAATCSATVPPCPSVGAAGAPCGAAPPAAASSCGVVPRNAERRVPERVPAILVDHFLSDVDTETGKRVRLVVRHAPDACRHLILGRQVLSEHRPLAAAATHRQVANRRRAAVDGKPRPQLRCALPIPRDGEQIAFERRRETGARLVLRQVTRQRSRCLIRCVEIRRRHRGNDECSNHQNHRTRHNHKSRDSHICASRGEHVIRRNLRRRAGRGQCR